MSVCWALRPAWLPFGTDPGWMVSQLPSSSEVSGKGKPATEQKPETHSQPDVACPSLHASPPGSLPFWHR